MFKSNKKVEIIVPAQVESVGKLRDFIEGVFRKNKIDDRVTNAFRLSIDEAATNVVKHGYAGRSGNIVLRLILDKEDVTAYLIDDGKYFDPNRVKDPNLQQYVQARKKGGLGILIIRRLMDSVEYSKTDEGNVLKISKSRKSNRRIKVAVPDMSITLKARYSLISSAILTLVIIIGYTYYYFQDESRIVSENLQQGTLICESLAKALAVDYDGDGIFDDASLIEKVDRKKNEFKDFIHEILVVLGPDKIVYYSTDVQQIENKYEVEAGTEVIQPQTVLRQLTPELAVYDNTSQIFDRNGNNVGALHVLFKKPYIYAMVEHERSNGLTTALIVLVIGYISIVVVIYIIMSPFQKLAEWVRVLGQGEDFSKQMDFSETGEIGEIARAFSDITTKFKDSQKRLVKQEQLQKEMQVAKEIQQTLLPTEFPKIESYEIGAFYEAAKEVGGDYFDFVEVDNDSLGIVVADVSGKGVPGSLVMTMIRTSLRTESRGLKDSNTVLSKVNNFVVNDMKKGMFVTVFYVIIDAKRRRLNYSSAGHNPMILYRGSTQKTYFLNPRGFPIGISLAEDDLFAKSITADTIQLKEDDILLLYTDGITEAMNKRREMFGEERLLKTIREYGNLPVQPFVEKIRDEVHSFTEDFPQNDDITLVVIKEESSAEKVELKRAKTAHELIQGGKSIRAACEQAGITTYAYYNKYKRKFEEEGIENVEVEDESISLEAKHLSIEEKTKIYDIIRLHPEYGPKRISEVLNTEKYGFTELKESRIYDELVRSRLNTKQLRESFIARSKRGKRIKPPGTPMLTLDGEVIIDKRPAYEASENEDETPATPETVENEAENAAPPKSFDELSDAESFLLNPLESILDKQGVDESLNAEVEPSDFELTSHEEIHPDTIENDEPVEDNRAAAGEEAGSEESGHIAAGDFSFEDLLPNEGPLFEESEYEEAGAESQCPKNFAPPGDSSQQVKENEASGLESHPSDEAAGDDSENSAAIDDSISFSAIDEVLNQASPWDSVGFSSYEDEEIMGDAVVEEDEASASEYADEIVSDEGRNSDSVGVDLPKNVTLPDQEESIASTESNQITEILTEIDDELSDIIPNKSESNQSHQIEAESIKAAESLINVKKSSINVEKSSFDADATQLDLTQNLNTVYPPGEIALRQEAAYQKTFLKSLAFYRKGYYNDAIKECEFLMEKFPGTKEVHSLLGNAYFRNRMYQKAALEYQRVKTLDPENLDAYENMGVIYANFGDYKKAIHEWQYILGVNPQRQDIKNNIKRASNLLNEKMVHEMT